MTQLTEHFSLEELSRSEKATELGIDNTPPDVVIGNLRKVAELLEQIRTLLGNKPIKINSGYRGLDLNIAVGGAKHSSHMKGCAVDFVCPSFGTPHQIMDAILASDIQFHRMIYEHTWVHIDIPYEPENEINQRLALEAHFTPGGPTTYTNYTSTLA